MLSISLFTVFQTTSYLQCKPQPQTSSHWKPFTTLYYSSIWSVGYDFGLSLGDCTTVVDFIAMNKKLWWFNYLSKNLKVIKAWNGFFSQSNRALNTPANDMPFKSIISDGAQKEPSDFCLIEFLFGNYLNFKRFFADDLF